jgi:uncharacterized protein with ATP-grasp and redox domains
MAVFPRIASPDTYRACEWDLLGDPDLGAYWVAAFRAHIDTLESAAIDSGYSEVQCQHMRSHLTEQLDCVLADPHSLNGTLDILALDRTRTDALLEAGIDNPFRALKERENTRALALLPRRLGELDALRDAARKEEIIRGIFAGNIFDMGAIQAARRFLGDETVPFASALAEVAPRPWLVDDLDRLDLGGHRRVMAFVDNAGADVVLGMIPLAREIARRGTEVVLAANTGPALNDITFAELVDLLGEASALDELLHELLASGRLATMATGTSAPLLDLAEVSEELADAARDIDLVIFEGMGRAIESNWSVELTIQTWNIATIKDEQVARHVGGRMYDCICRVRD